MPKKKPPSLWLLGYEAGRKNGLGRVRAAYAATVCVLAVAWLTYRGKDTGQPESGPTRAWCRLCLRPDVRWQGDVGVCLNCGALYRADSEPHV